MLDTLNLKTIQDPRGTLYALNSLPFTVKRVFVLRDVTLERGNHAHKNLWELLIVPVGSCRICVDDGELMTWKWLGEPNQHQAYLLPPRVWRTLDQFSKDCVLVSLCSEELDEQDYIRDYTQFKRWVQCQTM